MTDKVVDHSSDISQMYFTPEKVNFSSLISAVNEGNIEADPVEKEKGFAPGNAPFVSRAAFDRSYYRFAAFMAAPEHKPTFADPHISYPINHHKIDVDHL